MKIVGNLLFFAVVLWRLCVCVCFQSFDRSFSRQRENAGLPASVDRSTFDFVWTLSRKRARALETTWSFVTHDSCFPWLCDVRDSVIPTPGHKHNSVNAFRRNTFCIPFSFEMHFSVMRMAQRTESHTDCRLKTRDLNTEDVRTERNEIATAHRKEWVARCKLSHHMPCAHDARRPAYTRFESHKLPVGYNVSLVLPLNAHCTLSQPHSAIQLLMK